jgi:CopG family nickel-responsive transcriptional regulator
MGRIIRTGVSFPEELLRTFDRIIRDLGIESRSQAIQEAIRDFITMNSWRIADEEVAGAILVHYSHEEHGIEERLTDAQHGFLNIIPSALHIHLSREDCLLVIAVRGRALEVKELVRRLREAGKIKQLTYMIMPIR